jgi:hypothetical protein
MPETFRRLRDQDHGVYLDQFACVDEHFDAPKTSYKETDLDRAAYGAGY